MALIRQLTQTLSAGSTSVVFTDASIGSNSTIVVATNPVVVVKNAQQVGNTATITFEAQSFDVSVRIQISNIGEFDVEDNDESTDVDDALSANMGRVLSEEMDEISGAVESISDRLSVAKFYTEDATSGQILAYNATGDVWWNVDNTASRVEFTPPVGSTMVSTNVQNAIVEAYNHGGGGGGGSTISWNQIQEDGTKIATITVDGVPTDVYAPGGSYPTEVTYTMNTNWEDTRAYANKSSNNVSLSFLVKKTTSTTAGDWKTALTLSAPYRPESQVDFVVYVSTVQQPFQGRITTDGNVDIYFNTQTNANTSFVINCTYILNEEGEPTNSSGGASSADQVSFDPPTGMTSDNVQDAIEEVFQSVSDGKTELADAITDKGVPTSATDDFLQMALNIRAIEGDTRYATGKYELTRGTNLKKLTCGFRPKFLILTQRTDNTYEYALSRTFIYNEEMSTTEYDSIVTTTVTKQPFNTSTVLQISSIEDDGYYHRPHASNSTYWMYIAVG